MISRSKSGGRFFLGIKDLEDVVHASDGQEFVDLGLHAAETDFTLIGMHVFDHTDEQTNAHAVQVFDLAKIRNDANRLVLVEIGENVLVDLFKVVVVNPRHLEANERDSVDRLNDHRLRID